MRSLNAFVRAGGAINPRALTSAACAALLCACSEYVVATRTDVGPPAAGPAIVVTPDNLTFDALTPDATAIQSFTVSNVGDADLHLEPIVLEGTTAFTLLDPPAEATLAPGVSVPITVTFSPSTSEDHGWAHVRSNDPGDPEILVELSGLGLYPELAVTPSVYDFGRIPPGCTASTPITLTNLGLAPLEVTSLAAVGQDFAIEDIAVPLWIEPGASVSVAGSYTAGEDSADATLYVSSNDPIGLRSSVWTGRPGDSEDVEDRFTQGNETWEAVDVLVFVDQSGSMDDDQATLAANFGPLYETLEAAGLDWQLMVTNDDDGCNTGGILTAESPDAEGIFTLAVQAGGGAWTEAGLTVASNALSAAGPGGCNEGFLREDARTVLLLVSDEPEQSPSPWSVYTDAMVALSPGAAVVAIVGDLPSGCRTAAAGSGYVEASIATGGAFLSICTSEWSENFDALSSIGGADLRLVFELSQRPDPTTLVVTVNGTTSDEWRYDEPTNSVTFYASNEPPAFASVVASYRLAVDCDQ